METADLGSESLPDSKNCAPDMYPLLSLERANMDSDSIFCQESGGRTSGEALRQERVNADLPDTKSNNTENQQYYCLALTLTICRQIHCNRHPDALQTVPRTCSYLAPENAKEIVVDQASSSQNDLYGNEFPYISKSTFPIL